MLVTHSAIAATELQIDKAWVNLAPPGARANAAYLHIHNPGDSPVVIQSVSADCCKELVLHRTYYEHDKAVMEHLDQLSIPAKGKVVMKPGGLHIMLLEATSPLRIGDKVELNLHFSSGTQQTISVPVIAHGD